MKKFFYIFLFTFFTFAFFFSFSKKAYAAPCFTISAETDSSNPVLPAPGQQVKVTVTVKNRPSCVDGGKGERITVVWELANAQQNPSSFNPSFFSPQTDSYTLIADIPSGLTTSHTFTTTIIAGNTCVTSGFVWALASFTGGDQSSVATTASDHGVGAKLYGNVTDDQGNLVAAAITVSPSDNNCCGPTNSPGGFYEFNGLDCTNPHTVTATYNGRSVNKTIYSSSSGNSSSLCNGSGVRVDLVIPPPSTSTPVPTTVTSCPIKTCSYTTPDSACASGVLQCNGSGCDGLNCAGCIYASCLNTGSGAGGCDCVPPGITPADPTPTVPTATPAPFRRPPPLIESGLMPNGYYIFNTQHTNETFTARPGDEFLLRFSFSNQSDLNPPGNTGDNARVSNISLDWTIPADFTIVDNQVYQHDGVTPAGCSIVANTISCSNLYPAGSPMAPGGVDGRVVKLQVRPQAGGVITIPAGSVVVPRITNPHFPETGRNPGNEWGRRFDPDQPVLVDGWNQTFVFSTNTVTVDVPLPLCPSPPTNIDPDATNATFACSNSVVLKWDKMANADWYNIRVDDWDNTKKTANGPVANNCGQDVLHDVCINRLLASSYCSATTCQVSITVTPGTSYKWWIHSSSTACGEDSASSIEGRFNTLCGITPTSTPTSTPTPTLPVGVLGVSPTATCFPDNGTATNYQTISASWTNVGRSYQVVRRGGGIGTDETVLCTDQNSFDFLNPVFNTSTSTVSVTSYSLANCQGSTQSKTETVTNAVCNGSNPTPTVTPTPGITCDPSLGQSCTTAPPGVTGCVVVGGEATLFCQRITGISTSMCQKCPVPTAPPACRNILPPNDKPTVVLQPDGHTVKITYSYVDEYGGDVPTTASIMRADKYGFRPGEGTQIGEQFGNLKTTIDTNPNPDQLHYYQLSSGNISSNTFAAKTEKTFPFGTCFAGAGQFRNPATITAVRQTSSTSTQINFELTYIVLCGYGLCNPYPSAGSPPSFLRVQRANGLGSAFVPWVVGTGQGQNYTIINNVQGGGYPSALWKANYTVDTPPGTNSTFTVSGYEGGIGMQECALMGGAATFQGTTADSVAPTPNPFTLSNVSATVTRAGVPINLLYWDQAQPGGNTVNIYRNNNRWSDGPRATNMQSVFNRDTSTYTWTATDDLASLPIGTYYYGVEFGNFKFCVPNGSTSNYLRTDQGSVKWEGVSVSGKVFLDRNKNNKLDVLNVDDRPYPGATVTLSANGVTKSTTTDANGDYILRGVSSAGGTVTLTRPTDYKVSYPGGASYTLKIPCDANALSPRSMDINPPCLSGNIIGANFALRPFDAWFQGIGGDMRIDTGFNDRIPPSTPTKYASLGNTPGIIFTGASTPDFGQGMPSIANWIVSDLFTSVTANTIRTSYDYMIETARRNGITLKDLDDECTGGLGNCTLKNSFNQGGVYKAEGNVKLNTFTFDNKKDYVILVNGDLLIKDVIKVKNGSTVTFSVKGDITFDKGVGSLPSQIGSHIEGFYSADKSIIIEGNAPLANPVDGGDCIELGKAGKADKRLNIAGAIVANAGLTGGTLQNQRDFCEGANGNISYPTFTITERPDLILNAPDFIKSPNTLWQEVAP